MSEFDDIAADYDATRGGEPRGDQYAADLDARLPRGDGPILEIGVGTGVVALGLRRRGRPVIGLDISAPMLARAMPSRSGWCTPWPTRWPCSPRPRGSSGPRAVMCCAASSAGPWTTRWES